MWASWALDGSRQGHRAALVLKGAFLWKWAGVGLAGQQREPGVLGHCWEHCWEMPWSRAAWGWGGGATASALEMSPGVAALKGAQVGSLNQPQCPALFPWEPQSLHPQPPGVLKAMSPLQVGSQGRVRSRREQLCPKSCRGRRGRPRSSGENVLSPLNVRWGHQGPERLSCHLVRIQHQTQNGSRSPARTCCHLSGRVTTRPAASETPLSWSQDLWTSHLTGQRGLCRRD